MKRLLIAMCVVLLQGCSFATARSTDVHLEKGRYEVEQDARLQIVLPDTDYAKTLQNLWNTTYPAHKNALQFREQGSLTNSDLAWMSDTDVLYEETQAYSLAGLDANVDYPWPSAFEQEAWKDRFFPVSGSGYLFVYNEKTAASRGWKENDITKFEQLKGIHNAYYQNRSLEYVLPFFFASEDDQDAVVPMKEVIASSQFLERLHRYRSFYKELELSDGTLNDVPFYEDGGYVSGLIPNDGAYRKSLAYTSLHLHFASMPKYQGYSLHPILDVYGFMVNANTRYPNAAHAFLQLIRSKEGIQTMLEHSNLLPLIRREDVEGLGIYDVCTKQILIAMNDSQLRNSSYIQEKPSIPLMDLYAHSNLLSLLQNSMYTKEKDSSVQKVLDNDIRHWILTQ